MDATLGGSGDDASVRRLFGIEVATWDAATIARSLALFLAAGLCEIGGGYLVWLFMWEGRGFALGALGGAVLFLYGVIPTLQPAHFGRVYAAYGGVFVILSLLWGWRIDGFVPDHFDWIGAASRRRRGHHVRPARLRANHRGASSPA
jgi:small multidrug resistance family-3 protein